MFGSLMCLTDTRLDICFAVNTLSQFLMDPRHVHLDAKHVLRYLKGTIEYGLKYDTNQNTNLHSYVDSNWTGSATKRKSTLGCFFSLRSSMIYWFRRMRSCMELTTVEA